MTNGNQVCAENYGSIYTHDNERLDLIINILRIIAKNQGTTYDNIKNVIESTEKRIGHLEEAMCAILEELRGMRHDGKEHVVEKKVVHPEGWDVNVVDFLKKSNARIKTIEFAEKITPKTIGELASVKDDYMAQEVEGYKSSQITRLLNRIGEAIYKKYDWFKYGLTDEDFEEVTRDEWIIK